nr:ORF2 [Torque teno felis virus]
MEPPLPGPALMLPAIDLSNPPDLDSHLTYKKREAEWKRLVSQTHKNWCLCGSYLNHFLPPESSLKNSTSCGEEKGDAVSDADMAGIADESEVFGGGDISSIDGDLRYLNVACFKIYLDGIELCG